MVEQIHDGGHDSTKRFPPHVLVHCPDPVDRAEVLPLLPEDLEPRVASGWTLFQEWAPAYPLALIVAGQAGDPSYHTRLYELGHAHPLLVVVLVADSQRGIRHLMRFLPVEELVLRAGLTERLPRAFARVREGLPLIQTRRAIRLNTEIPGPLREALRLVVDGRAAIRNQGELARRVACHRTTLLRQWRNTVPDASASLKDLLDTHLLLRVLRSRRESSSWDAVSDDLGTTVPTLRAIARRTCDHSLDELAGSPAPLRDHASDFAFLLAASG